MSDGDPSGSLRDIRTLFGHGRLADLTDRQLLERFVSRNDSSTEDAFTMLLERHGPMVWGVCRRLLPDRNATAGRVSGDVPGAGAQGVGGQDR